MIEGSRFLPSVSLQSRGTFASWHLASQSPCIPSSLWMGKEREWEVTLDHPWARTQTQDSTKIQIGWNRILGWHLDFHHEVCTKNGEYKSLVHSYTSALGILLQHEADSATPCSEPRSSSRPAPERQRWISSAQMFNRKQRPKGGPLMVWLPLPTNSLFRAALSFHLCAPCVSAILPEVLSKHTHLTLTPPGLLLLML